MFERDVYLCASSEIGVHHIQEVLKNVPQSL